MFAISRRPPSVNQIVDMTNTTNRCQLTCCELLGMEGGGIPRWKEMLEKLPEYRINDDGALAEWSFPGIEDNYSHRHGSHF